VGSIFVFIVVLPGSNPFSSGLVKVPPTFYTEREERPKKDARIGFVSLGRGGGGGLEPNKINVNEYDVYCMSIRKEKDGRNANETLNVFKLLFT
jgi:hypothetical protein